MYNHNKAQQSKNRVHISSDILYVVLGEEEFAQQNVYLIIIIGKKIFALPCYLTLWEITKALHWILNT